MSSSNSSRPGFSLTTLIAALAAALAAAASLALSLPIWAMFIGWIAFSTRGLNILGTVENLVCVGLGLTIGVIASSVIAGLAPMMGMDTALPMVVFGVAIVVVSLRGLPILNNLLGYFLGLVAWFAAHLEPSLENFVHLFTANSIGAAAGLLSHLIPTHLIKSARA
ncbi:DUF1097 domain-containing protein [Xanthomonas massiliensis]|uniref:DUF1097 domain-containing protein n=1 Tax=Xanthomonas massiliensis TaxID=1720302 RepID=UPI000824907B|nr:DUF1097 domain-containing protein [Xanthomonas massiliensis]